MRAINQVVLPLNIGYKIPDNDPVVLLSELCDELDYTKICEKYLRTWRKHSPKTLFKILVYGEISEHCFRSSISKEIAG